MKNLLPVLFTLTSLSAITFAPAVGQGGSVNNAPGVFGGDETIGTIPLTDGAPYLKRSNWGQRNQVADGVVIVKRAPWLARGDCLEISRDDGRVPSIQVISSIEAPEGNSIGLIAATVSQSWRNGYCTNTLTTVLEPGETEPQARARLAAAVAWLQTSQVSFP